MRNEDALKKNWVFLGSLLSLCLILTGCQGQKGLAVRDPWARPAVAGGVSAVYFVIENPGDQADSLTGVRSTHAGGAEIHASELDPAGTMSMHPQHAVAIPPGGQVVFEPGDLHVMLVSVNEDLKAGDTISLTLEFDQAGEVSLAVPVKQP